MGTMDTHPKPGWFSSTVSILNTASLLVPGIATLHWPSDICSALLKACDASTSSGSETTLVIMHLWGICLAIAAIPSVVAVIMAWVSHRSGNVMMESTSVLLTRVSNGTVALIWFGMALVVLVEEQHMVDTALYGIAGAAGGLGFVNAISLMISCWPSDPRTSHGATAGKRVQPNSMGSGRRHKSSSPIESSDETQPLLRGRKDRALKYKKVASKGNAVSINSVDDDIEQELHTHLGTDDASTQNADYASDSDGDVDENLTDTDPAVLIASSSAHRRARMEERAQHTRERGYGTLKLLQLARPHKYWLYAGCVVLLVRLPFSLSIPHWVSVWHTQCRLLRKHDFVLV